jgi:hypothetical protein
VHTPRQPIISRRSRRLASGDGVVLAIGGNLGVDIGARQGVDPPVRPTNPTALVA